MCNGLYWVSGHSNTNLLYLIIKFKSHLDLVAVKSYFYCSFMDVKLIFCCLLQVFCDNYLDGGYHVPYAHKDLASGLQFDSYSTTVCFFASLSILWIRMLLCFPKYSYGSWQAHWTPKRKGVQKLHLFILELTHFYLCYLIFRFWWELIPKWSKYVLWNRYLKRLVSKGVKAAVQIAKMNMIDLGQKHFMLSYSRTSWLIGTFF